MLSDRTYMRDNYPRERTSVLAWLISAIVAAFVLQLVFERILEMPGALEHYFGLSTSRAARRPRLDAGELQLPS